MVWECKFCGKNNKACWQYEHELRGWVNDFCAHAQTQGKEISRDYIEDKDYSVPVVRRCRACGELSEHCYCGSPHQIKESWLERFRAGISDNVIDTD